MHSANAERATLGAILFDNNSLEIVRRTLQCGDFFLRENQIIFERMNDLAEQHRPIDVVTLTEDLNQNKQMVAAGGKEYLIELMGDGVKSENIEHYIRTIKDYSSVRNLIIKTNQIRVFAYLPKNPAEILRSAARDMAFLSAQPKEEVRAERKLVFQTAAEIEAESGNNTEWVVRPWVAAGGITEITGKVKVAGKTTFVTHMVRKVLDGSEFLGERTMQTPVVYLTEQPSVSFRVAMEKVGVLGRNDLIVLFWNRTVGCPWETVANAAIAECNQRGAKLLVVDTLSQFAGLLGDAENNAGDALAAMRPLQQAAGEGIAVIVVRHERKQGGRMGDSGRGSSAYAGAVDILMTIRRPEGNTNPALREIDSVSRLGETPNKLCVELTSSGYQALGEGGDIAAQKARQAILHILPWNEEKALSIDDIEKFTNTPRATLQRVLNHLIEDKDVCRLGKGHKGDPFRYRVPYVFKAAQTARPGVGQKKKVSTPPG